MPWDLRPLSKEQTQAVKGFGTTQSALVINRTAGKKAQQVDFLEQMEGCQKVMLGGYECLLAKEKKSELQRRDNTCSGVYPILILLKE